MKILYLPFDLAQGGESFDAAQDRESIDVAQDREPVERLVEPFRARPVEFRYADPPKAGFHRARVSYFEFCYTLESQPKVAPT